MIRTLYRHRSGTVVLNLPIDQLAGAVREAQSRVWIDLQQPTADETNTVFKEIFRFHPLAIEDVISDVHVPKLDDYGTYLYLVFHSFRLGDERMDIDTFEIDVFLGSNYLITIHGHESVAIEKMWQEEYHRERGLARGPAMLLYELLDRQIDSYIPLVDQFENRIEELGDLIFYTTVRNENQILDEILTAKSSALRVRRILLPQREVLHRLTHNDYSVIPADTRIYFQDVYDHVVRLADLADSMRDLVNSTTATHLTITNNRLNEIMKVLAVISTVFMPLSFIASVYGMNFEYMPGLAWRWAYPAVWAVFLAIGAVMLLYFRRRRWL